MTLARPTISSVLRNMGASFGIGTGTTGAGIVLGSRGVFGAESAAHIYATAATDESGNPLSVTDAFAKGALPEYEFGSRMATQGISGLQPSDALLALYFLNLKTDPKGTFRDANGKLRNARNNPRGQRPGSFAKDPRVNKSGGNGKAYEDSSKFDDFKNSVNEFKQNNGLLNKAWELFQKQNWKELENLFKTNNINGGWPRNRGFISKRASTLKTGFKIDRYGGRVDPKTGKFSDKGTYVFRKGEPFQNRAIPEAYENNVPQKSYEIIKPIEVTEGKSISWHDQPGMGTQYELPKSIDYLIQQGYIKELP